MAVRIGLESYEVLAKHGVFEYEKEDEQPFIVSIWATLYSEPSEDKLEETLNYADLQIAVRDEVVNSKPVNLMETLCQKLVKNLSSNQLISALSIRIEKPDAPFPHPGGLAIVEHEWTRD